MGEEKRPIDAPLLADRWQATARAREAFLAQPGAAVRGVRPLVRDSWVRSESLHVNPDITSAPVALYDDALAHAREAHALRKIIPIVRRLLVEDGTGMLVAVGDAEGRALWVEGDPEVVHGAERIHLMAGAQWGESQIGTNGIGTAIALGKPTQVFGSEHYAAVLHQWSCNAAPVHDPTTREVLGFINVSGGPAVSTPQAALLVRSAVAAIESELRLSLNFEGMRTLPGSRPGPARLSVLGRDRGTLELDGRAYELSLRHAELLLLLADRPDGIAAGELAWLMYEHDAADVTVRAEISRLRKAHPGLVSDGRPYRLHRELRSDVADIAEALRAGNVERAVELYRGAILPRSTAPGVVNQRYYLSGWLRSALLCDAGSDLLLRYAYSPDGLADMEVWRACLDRLPERSPRRAEVESMLTSLQRQLGVS